MTKQSTNNPSLCIIETTTATQDEADQIAALLLERQLAACVQSSVITSQYIWQGSVTRSDEIRLSIKTATHLYAEIEAVLLANHPYDCPEILMYPLTNASQAYRAWLLACIKPQTNL